MTGFVDTVEKIEFPKVGGGGGGLERASLNRFDIRGYANEALKRRR